jgi:ATP-binding cassette, subfamily F, member 3
MISIDGLTVEFGGTTLFKDVSFAVNEKDRIALMGKNGAGKSTLAENMAGVREAFGWPGVGTQRHGNCLFAAAFMTEDNRTVFDETSQAFAHISMKCKPKLSS